MMGNEHHSDADDRLGVPSGQRAANRLDATTAGASETLSAVDIRSLGLVDSHVAATERPADERPGHRPDGGCR